MKTLKKLECPACGRVQAASLTVCPECGGRLQPDTSTLPIITELDGGRPVPSRESSNNRDATIYAGVWRDGNLLVFDSSADLPDRCLRCNLPAELNPIKKKLKLRRPLLDLLGLVPGLEVINWFREPDPTASVRLRFCRRHMRQLHVATIANWAVLVLGLTVIIWAAVMPSGILALIGLGLVLASGAIGTAALRFAKVKRIDGGCVWLAGVSKSYLSDLPLIPERGCPDGR